MPNTVLVPLDLGREADRALPVADSLARRIGARLDIVSVTSSGVDRRVEEREVRDHARPLGVEVAEVHIRNDDDVVAGVRDTAADCDAVVCCATHARGALGEWPFQSVSAALVRRSTSPLLLVGPEVTTAPAPAFTEIVACAYHAPLRPKIASTAATWGRSLEAKARLLTIVGDRPTWPRPGSP
jgi:nucleotide-binding universal stress UspA family protein